MKNLNKVLAMVLVVVMAMTSVVFADFTDVTEETAYAEAINVGAALGLFNGYEDGTFAPEGDITRAEFAAIVVRALNQEAQAAAAASAASDFADVAEDHWAKGYINIVSKLGIVNGYGDGNFGPEDKVLYEQAVKMLVVALGYEPAIGTAGYPVGYLTKASEIGLTTGVKGSNGSAANRGIVAQLTVNALNIPLMKQTGYGTWVDYEVQDGIYNVHRTLLSENLGMVKLSAIVTETSKSSTTASHIAEFVKVDVKNNFKTRFAKENGGDDYTLNEDYEGLKVLAGDTNISSLVGVKAVIYAAYDELDQEATALYAAKDLTKVDELVVAASDIDDVTVETAAIEFSYWENDTDKKPEIVTIAKNASVYVNGLKESTANAAEVVAKLWTGSAPAFYGPVTLQLLDDDADVDFDTIFIESYKTIVVEENNTARYRITPKNDEDKFSYDPEEKGLDVTLYDENGNEIDFADLVENDVITYKEYTKGNKKVVEAYKVTTTVTGTVTGIGGETGDREYVIGGETYDACASYVEDGDIALGDEGVFFFDLLGNIVYFEVTESVNTNYAYVIDIAAKGTIDKKAVLKLFTFDGQYGTLETASKVKVDGISNIKSVDLTTGEDVALETDKSTSDTTNLIKKQGSNNYVIEDGKITGITAIAAGDVITYATNSSGYITSIDRAAEIDNLDDAKGKFSVMVKDLEDDLDYKYAGTFTYNEKAESLETTAGKLYVNENTVIIVADLDSVDDIEDLEEDDVMLYSAANLVDETKLENAIAFNVDNNKVAGLIFVGKEVDIVETGSILAIATGYGSANNDLGDPVYAIKAFQDGELKSGDKALVTKDDSLYGIDEYYTFIPKYNAAGEVKAAIVLATIADDEVTFNSEYMTEETEDPDNDVKYFYGAVTERNKKEYVIGGKSVAVANATNVYVYYSAANSKNKVTLEDYTAIEIDVDEDEMYFDTEEVSEIYAVAREYDGDVVDLILYVIK